MHHILRALFGEFFKVGDVALIVEHRRARKAAPAQLVVEIDILRIACKGVQPVCDVPLLVLYRIGEAYKLYVVLLYEIGIEVAGGVGR